MVVATTKIYQWLQLHLETWLNITTSFIAATAIAIKNIVAVTKINSSSNDIKN
jgi:hypothetical protein